MKRKIRKIIGGLFIVVGSFFLLVMILIPIAFSMPTDYTNEINWNAVLILAVLQIISMTAGFLIFRWEHYLTKRREYKRREKAAEQERKWRLREEKPHPVLEWYRQCREKYVECRQAKERAALAAEEREREETARRQQEEKEHKERLLSLPRGQMPQRVSIHFNRHAGAERYILFCMFFLLAAGSIIVIPALVAGLDHTRLVVAACILTVTFWVGFFGAIYIYGDIQISPTRAFLTTNERIIYYVQLAPRDYGRTPVTKIAGLIHNIRVQNMDAVLRARMERYLHSDAFLLMAENAVNGVKEAGQEWIITRLNSPGIVRKGIFGSRIEYWDERKEAWVRKNISKSNEGYARICDMISAGSRRYTE